MAIEHYTHNCGCTITVYGDGSAPPDIEYCDDHQIRGPQVQIFELILAGGEASRLKAAELIRTLSPTAKRDLRATIQTIDYVLDDVFLAELREKRRG